MSFIRPTRAQRFDDIVVAHLDAAYNLARWLTRNDGDAEDVVQEACLRAFRFIDGFRGGNQRAWFLTIVRNTYYTWSRKNQPHTMAVPFSESDLSAEDWATTGSRPGAPEDIDGRLQQQDAGRLLTHALELLPPEFREILVLRELEDLSYREIAQIAGIPLGTVMSRLARARKLLQRQVHEIGKER